MARKVRLKAYAKINLYLDVISKRGDDYHDIRSIMQSVLLADELVILDADGLELTLSGKFEVSLEDNLVLKAARALQSFTEREHGASIILEKRIPVAAGLGGGSADAAATLIGLNMLWDLNLSLDDLQIIGGEIGADIPFCLRGGACLVEGKGERVTSLTDNFTADIVIIKPPFNLSTSRVYSDFDKVESFHAPSVESIITALYNGNLNDVSSSLMNVLEEAVIPTNPIIKEIKERALRAGALGALMSGSGSSVFAIAESKKAALKVADSLKGFYGDIIVTATSQKGIDIY